VGLSALEKQPFQTFKPFNRPVESRAIFPQGYVQIV
jgi:hypothetical protein